jgi:hypothetical protein
MDKDGDNNNNSISHIILSNQLHCFWHSVCLQLKHNGDI